MTTSFRLGALVERLTSAPRVERLLERLAHGSDEGVASDDTHQLAVELEIVIGAPVERVWQALVRAEHRAAWWSYLELDPRPGGVVVERWRNGAGREVTTGGQVVELEPPRRLRCTWRDDDWPAFTEVEFDLRSESETTRVNVRHVGWERLGGDGARLAAAHRIGWRLHLENLKAFAESHAGLRDLA
jgi:uncharacterized protein YndB with AHSA1/START domain